MRHLVGSLFCRKGDRWPPPKSNDSLRLTRLNWDEHAGHPLLHCFFPSSILSPRTRETSWMLSVLPWWQQDLNLSLSVQQRKVGAVFPLFCWDSGMRIGLRAHVKNSYAHPGEATQAGRNREGQEGNSTPRGGKVAERTVIGASALARQHPGGDLLSGWFQHSLLNRSLSPDPCSWCSWDMQAELVLLEFSFY